MQIGNELLINDLTAMGSKLVFTNLERDFEVTVSNFLKTEKQYLMAIHRKELSKRE